MIYLADPGLIIGFHGCDAAVSEKIINSKTMLKASNNTWDWLGPGMYFWQNNYDRAMDFALNPPGNALIKQPSVLGAVISLGNCLDLSDKRYNDILRQSFRILQNSAISESSELPVNDDHQHSKDKVLRKLDCAVIKNIHSLNDSTGEPPFDTVRGVFIEGEPLYEGAGFYEKTHVQICVRNPNRILGFFNPRGEIKWP